MAATRYGRIYHTNHHYNNLKFPSADAREQFKVEFEKYHASHDHDGEVSWFEDIKAADLKSYERGPKDVADVSIDGYTTYEILEYHNRDFPDTYTHYRVPSCCVSPIIVLERGGTFIESGTLERHALSGMFGDMPEDDFQKLLLSVETDGFMDPIIRMYDGKVLDGWHRYRAAVELNLVRKLMFMPYDEEKEGSAEAFVSARNLERRHLSASQRGQIVVEVNTWLAQGNVKAQTDSGVSNETPKPKSTAELAKEARVGRATINRAKEVSLAGRADEVISGKKSVSQVIVEETLKDLWEQISAEMKAWKQRHIGIGYASKTMIVEAYRKRTDSEQEGAATVEELKAILILMRDDVHSYAVRVRYLRSGEEGASASENPYSDTAAYPDKKLINAVIPALKSEVAADDHEVEVYENAQEQLDFIRHELQRRGYTVDEELLNIDKVASDALENGDEGSDTEQVHADGGDTSEADAPEDEHTEELQTLVAAVEAELEHWKQRNTTHVTNLRDVSLENLIGAYRYNYGDRSREGAEATAEELCECLRCMQENYMPMVLTAEVAAGHSQRPKTHKPEPESPEPEPEPESSEPETDSPDETIDVSDVSGCRAELRRILRLQGELNKGNIDYRDLCDRYGLKKKQVQEIADSVRAAAFKAAEQKHNTYRDQISNFWLANRNLLDRLDFVELQTTLIEMFGLRESAFKKTFHGLNLLLIEKEAETLEEIFNDLTKLESQLLRRVLGQKTLVEVIVSYADEEGEIHRTWFSDEGEGVPLNELSIAVRGVLEKYSRHAKPFNDTESRVE